MSKSNDEAEVKIEEALKIQAELLKRLQVLHKRERGSKASSRKYIWCDLAAINQTNKLMAEAVGFNSPCGEGSKILAEVSAKVSR